MSAQDSRTEGRKDPFRAALPLGTVGGIRVRVDLSTAVIFALIAFGLAAWQFPAVNPHQATLTYALAAVVTTVVFFASLLAHELAHSLVARRYGLTVTASRCGCWAGSPTWGAKRRARRPKRGSRARAR